MPGKRYNYRITQGIWKGRRARITGIGSTDGNYLVDVQGVKLPEGTKPTLRGTALRSIPQKSPRRTKGGKKR